MSKSQTTQTQEHWSFGGGTDANPFRKLMSNASCYVRDKQYNLFLEFYKPSSSDKVLDVGVSPDSTLKDTNFFEQMFPFKKNLSVASIEDCRNLISQYKLAKYIKIVPNKKLAVKDGSFDIVVSWATLEHVGSRDDQKNFVRELCRIGKHIFITTPDRYSIYEPHTVLVFVHWLPKNIFRCLLKHIGKNFWAEEANWNMLSLTEVEDIIAGTPLKAKKFTLFGLPSHIVIYGTTA